VSRLSGIVHALDNLERDLRRRGFVQQPLELADGERERAERVARNASESERSELYWSAVRRAGVTMTWLVAAAAGEQDLPEMTPEPEVVAKVERRIRIRQRLGLGRVDSLDDAEDCRCSPADQQRRLKLDKIGRWAR
jgi:hypothetical protein